MSKALLWFRQDLRLDDNAALAQAVTAGHEIVPVYIWAPHEDGSWAPGGASRWWLHHALEDLDAQLQERGASRLILRRAQPDDSSESILRDLAKTTGADAIYWNRRYEPAAIARDKAIKAALREDGFEVESANSSMLFEPHEIANRSGKPFKVFTPMWKHYQSLTVPPVVSLPADDLRFPSRLPTGDPLESLDLLPSIPWDTGFHRFWESPTRDHMLNRLDSFIEDRAEAYPDARDLPAEDGTTRLSPFLHFGQLGPREVWARFAQASNHSARFDEGIMRQIIWREFAHHLLYHFSETPEKPLQDGYEMFPWKSSKAFVNAWQKGETGYPIVDAGMRQLWQTGWMHNRVRMIVGSLLVKHLLQHWHEGARWFWDTLVDADLANNTLGWQWIGGCGADAAPYFRIFNPMTQGERFDADGAYVRKYVPELAKVPKKFIHRPWEMGELALSGCDVVLGRDYPEPIISHEDGRKRALDAFQEMKDRRDG